MSKRCLMGVTLLAVAGCSLVFFGCPKPPVPPITPSPHWKTALTLPDDAFLNAKFPTLPGWVKFTILKERPDEVYFQDSVEYPFHYDFATERLDPYFGISRGAFDQVTRYADGQEAILGAVIVPAAAEFYTPAEYGVQFVRQTPYSAQEIVDLFALVTSKVEAPANTEAYYFPAFEQISAAQEHEAFLESHGVRVSSTDRWSAGNAVYAPGWALGVLNYVPAEEIEAAFLEGTLLPEDILVTDGVPAEVPFVAGIVSLTASTPNSHVAILANTYGVPFVHLSIEADAERAEDLVGHTVVLRAYSDYSGAEVKLIDVEGVLDAATIAEILALKAPAALDIAPMAAYGAYSASTDGLLPEDIQYFGGKAANFGLLRTAIPNKAPVAMAFSFDLYNDFLDQDLGDGTTLREAIHARLDGYSYPPADMAALDADLDAVQDLFKDAAATPFAPALRDAVLDALQDPLHGFEAGRKIRFRSSTNVEDSAAFTGAGLYDSFSGCLADDLDSDAVGPSACDADWEEERSVFHAIRKVFASFYNANAFLERLRHGIDEDEVGMALLVHHSFPDPIELANGVGTLRRNGVWSTGITLATQTGANSVANPEGGAIPEEVTVGVYPFGYYPELLRPSNLVLQGDTVMTWEADYIALSEMLVAVAERFEAVTGHTSYTLDFEYKKVAPAGDLVVKQVRQLPEPDKTPSLTPFLLNEPTVYCTFQGEAADVFANHRLKSFFSIETENTWLDEASLAQSFFADTTLDYAADGQIQKQTGLLPSWPGAAHAFEDSVSSDTWAFGHLKNPRQYTLSVTLPALVSPAESPLLVIQDLAGPYAPPSCLSVTVDYAEPVLSWNWTGMTTTTSDTVSLCPCPQPQDGDILREYHYEGTGGVALSTSFYWPPDPGAAAGYTAPLSRWVKTVIEGYTTEPIVLHGDFSQTYRPEHHNFSEHFLFEPRLEPGISATILSELEAKDIRLIHWYYEGYGGSTVTTYGFDAKASKR